MDILSHLISKGVPASIIAEDLGISEGTIISGLMLESGNKHVGLFIPIPGDFSDQFPSGRSKEDDSPPHITLLYIGDVEDDDEGTIYKACKEALSKIKPFTVKFGNYAEFQNDDRRVPHVQIESDRLHELHKSLKKDLKSAGVEIDDTHPVYKPHATLNYVDVKGSYEGPVPSGEFEVKKIALWGFESDHNYRL